MQQVSPDAAPKPAPPSDIRTYRKALLTLGGGVMFVGLGVGLSVLTDGTRLYWGAVVLGLFFMGAGVTGLIRTRQVRTHGLGVSEQAPIDATLEKLSLRRILLWSIGLVVLAFVLILALIIAGAF